MTAAINDFVKEQSQHFKPNKCKKTSTLQLRKLSNEKHNLPLINLSFFPSLSANGAQIRIHSSTCHLGTGGTFSSSTVHPFGNRYTKILQSKEVEVDQAFSTTGLKNHPYAINPSSVHAPLAKPARYPHLTHLTLSSSGELLLSSSIASIIS